MRRRRHPCVALDGSMALILVLSTLALITAVGVEILNTSNVSASIVANRRDAEKALQLARAALRWSAFRLQMDTALDRIPPVPGTNYGGRKDDLSEFQWAVPITYPFAAVLPPEEDGSAPSASPFSTDAPPDIGGYFVSSISDESARINLNDVGSSGVDNIVRWSGASEVLENLLLGYRFRPYFKARDHREVLWAMDDWTDADSQVNHLGGGVEDLEYRIEGVDLNVKNAPFYTVDEIKQLKPMTAELFEELEPFVTVYPFDGRSFRVFNMVRKDMGRINVNTAPLEILEALFSRQYTINARARLECAQQAAKTRTVAAFRSIKGAEPSFTTFIENICGFASRGSGEAPPLSRAVTSILDVRSDVFRVEASGFTGEGPSEVIRTIRAVLSRKEPQRVRVLYWKVT